MKKSWKIIRREIKYVKNKGLKIESVMIRGETIQEEKERKIIEDWLLIISVILAVLITRMKNKNKTLISIKNV